VIGVKFDLVIHSEHAREFQTDFNNFCVTGQSNLQGESRSVRYLIEI